MPAVVPVPRLAPAAVRLPRPGARAFLAAAAVVFVASLVVGYFALRGLAPKYDFVDAFLLSSDMLFPAAVYDDLAADGYSLSTFRYSAATFAFPDLLLYGAVRVVAGSASAAAVPWVAAFYLLLVGSAAAAASAALPAGRKAIGVGGVLLAAAAYLGVTAGWKFATPAVREFLVPLYHGGAAMSVLLALALTAGLARSPGPGQAVLLLLLSAAATFSDRLFAVWFPLPLVVAAGTVGLLCRGTASRGLLVAVGATVVGCGVGAVGVRLAGGPDDALANYWTGGNLADLADRAAVLGRDWAKEARARNVLVIAAGGWVVLCSLALLRRVVEVARGKPSTGDDRFVFLAAFSLACLAVTTAVFLLSQMAASYLGHHPWQEFSRYFLGPQVLGWFGWAVAIALVNFDRRPAWVGRAAVAVPLLLAVLPVAQAARRCGPPTRDLAPYPDEVRQFDELCRANGLKYGLTDYAMAKRITVLSRERVVLRQVWYEPAFPDRPFTAFHWLSNAEWFWKPRVGDPAPLRYQFVAARIQPDNPTTPGVAAVVAAFGEPTRRLPFGGYELLVYDGQTGRAVREFGETDPVVSRIRLGLPHVPVAGE